MEDFIKQFQKLQERVEELEKKKFTKFKVTKAISYPGASFPRSGSFTSSGGTILIFVSASAFISSGNVPSIDVKVDNIVKGTIKVYTNEINSHKALVMDVIVLTNIASGNHTLDLVLATGASDSNDFSQATVLELPL